MSEYTDVRKNTHRVIETVAESPADEKDRAAAEEEIVEALFRIFFADYPQNSMGD